MSSSPTPRQRATVPAEAPPSISCEQVRTRLDALVDGELSADDDATVREHVTTCAACRQLEKSLRQLLVAIVRSDPHAVAPRRLRLRVAHLLAETGKAPDA